MRSIKPERHLAVFGSESKMSPLLTVVVATRNRARYLQDALTSILSQGIDLAIIVVRTQGDTEVPSVPAVADPRVSVLDCRHSSRASDGWAMGLESSSSPWSMTFDDDDLMFPGSLRRLLDLAVDHDLDLASGLHMDVGEDAAWVNIEAIYEGVRAYDEIPEATVPRVTLYTWVDVAGGHFPSLGKSVWRTELNSQVIGANQPPPGDSFFSTKLFAASRRAGFCRVVFRAHRVHPDSATSTIVGDELRDRATQYLRWASATFPEYATARNLAFSDRLGGV